MSSLLRPWIEHLGPRHDLARLDLTERGSLPAAWADRWRSAPAAPVLCGPDGRWLSGADLLEGTAAVAGRLSSTGARPGDVVLVAASASSALVVAHCAALRAGMVVVPMNPAATRRELEAVMHDARPRFAIVGPDPLARWAKEIDPDVLVTTPEIPMANGDPPPLDWVQGSDPAMIVYTSGTTGSPKGAQLSHANLLAGAESVRLAWEWDEGDQLILCLPLSHVHGLGIGLHGGLLAGSRVLLFERFDVEAVLSAAARGATMFFGVPTMYERLVSANGADRFGALRLCVSGSAPLSPALHERIEECCRQIVLERYGVTETLLTVSNPLNGERRAGTVGFPLPGVDVAVEETTGEILVRGPSVFSGYRGLPEISAAAFDHGWFRTGDIGAIDDGYLRIVGRAKELIISGGYNVYPREVEDVLRAFPGVRDAAVVGTPSSRWGEAVSAFVESEREIDLAALAEHAALELSFYKRPRMIQQVDQLPRNLLGKVLKDRLEVSDHEE